MSIVTTLFLKKNLNFYGKKLHFSPDIQLRFPFYDGIIENKRFNLENKENESLQAERKA